MGWFKGPRTLPLVLALLSDKRLTDGRDVSRVYLELLARHMDGGVIETEKRPGYAPDPLAELNRYQEFSLKKGAPAVDFSSARRL